MNTPELLSILSYNAFVLAAFALIPVVRRERAFFGLPVTSGFYTGEGRSLLRAYRASLAAVYLVAIFFSAILYTMRAPGWTDVVVVLLSLAAFLWRYAVAFRRVRPFRLQTAETRFASSLHPRRLSDYTHGFVEVAIVVLTFLPAITVLLTYRYLPSRIPVHWNFLGEADRWTAKSPAACLFLPLFAIYLQAWLFVLKRDCLWLRMTLPATRTEEYLQYKERALWLGTVLLDWVRVMLGVLLGLLALMPIAAIPQWPLSPFPLIILFCASLGILVIGLACLIARWLAVSNAVDRKFGFAVVHRSDDAEHWQGGILYYNRKDPAFFVEKLGGLGYTINCAHPRALLHLAALLGIPLLIIFCSGYL